MLMRCQQTQVCNYHLPPKPSLLSYLFPREQLVGPPSPLPTLYVSRDQRWRVSTAQSALHDSIVDERPPALFAWISVHVGATPPQLIPVDSIPGIVVFDTNYGPLFLPDSAAEECLRWTEMPFVGQPALPQCLGIVGSVKCGKTSLLFALPAFVALRPRTYPRAVVLSVTFVDGEPPVLAARRVLSSVIRFASSLGINLLMREDDVDARALLIFSDVMGELAAAVSKKGSQLFALFDESQVRQLYRRIMLATLRRLCRRPTRVLACAFAGSSRCSGDTCRCERLCC